MEMLSKDQQELYSSLSIRQFDPVADLDDYMVWASDDNVSRFCSWDSHTSKEQALEYINKKIINHPCYKVICLNDKPIGAIMVSLEVGNDRCRAEVGYVLGARYWGRGIATWAVKTTVKTVFEERPELERVEAWVDVENVGSQKVLEKAGFVKEGVLRKYWHLKGKTRDMIVFSFLRMDEP